ncbi:hypothetical protein DFH09DRAFT_1464610 [Mycena vulgaris]|nr:hypothetical protein DFH09DRAFT_1464610 [Mycena vulgaris]
MSGVVDDRATRPARAHGRGEGRPYFVGAGAVSLGVLAAALCHRAVSWRVAATCHALVLCRPLRREDVRSTSLRSPVDTSFRAPLSFEAALARVCPNALRRRARRRFPTAASAVSSYLDSTLGLGRPGRAEACAPSCCGGRLCPTTQAGMWAGYTRGRAHVEGTWVPRVVVLALRCRRRRFLRCVPDVRGWDGHAIDVVVPRLSFPFPGRGSLRYRCAARSRACPGMCLGVRARRMRCAGPVRMGIRSRPAGGQTHFGMPPRVCEARGQMGLCIVVLPANSGLGESKPACRRACSSGCGCYVCVRLIPAPLFLPFAPRVVSSAGHALYTRDRRAGRAPHLVCLPRGRCIFHCQHARHRAHSASLSLCVSPRA